MMHRVDMMTHDVLLTLFRKDRGGTCIEDDMVTCIYMYMITYDVLRMIITWTRGVQRMI